MELGGLVESVLDGLRATLAFLGDFVVAVLGALRRPGSVHFGQFASLVERAGADGAPIVLLINFLVGGILGLQGAIQLHRFGADQFLADMVGLSMVRELGPLMTAIVLAARSGSRDAAQLGSMVVSEEISALEQMGIRPMAFLVAPKVVACAFASVTLSVVFDVVGMSGGALFAWSVAGIELAAYGEQLRQALQLSDFAVALTKAATFGAAVGVVGCALGLRVKGGSEGVGRATTNAVVLGIFMVIVIDAIFVACQRVVG